MSNDSTPANATATSAPVVTVLPDGSREITIGSWALHAAGDPNAEPRMRDLDLAERLGYEHQRNIRKLIADLRRAGKLNDLHHRDIQERAPGQVAARPEREYWLTEAQALKVVAKSETAAADALLDEVIAVFIMARRGLLPTAAQPVDASLAMAQITALTALVTKLADNVGDMQQRLATGHAFASGTVSPMVGNGIKRRLHVMGQRLAACKVAKNVASGRQKQTVHLRAVVGWPGKWNGLPVAKEADCMRELGAMERAVDTIAAALNGGKQLVLAIDNTKRAA